MRKETTKIEEDKSSYGIFEEGDTTGGDKILFMVLISFLAELKLKNVYNELPLTMKNQESFSEILPGYLQFQEFIISQQEDLSHYKTEEYYKLFHKKSKDNKKMIPFLNIFEFIQSKSYSEAICETIGSMMKIHGGKGRHLLTFNFNKEIYLNFNMPPLHIMKNKIIPKIAKDLVSKGKSYSRKNKEGRFDRYKFTEVSATVGNFRLSEQENCHTPYSIFN